LTIYKENIPQTLEPPEYLGLSLQQMLVVLDPEFPISLFTEIMFLTAQSHQFITKHTNKFIYTSVSFWQTSKDIHKWQFFSMSITSHFIQFNFFYEPIANIITFLGMSSKQSDKH